MKKARRQRKGRQGEAQKILQERLRAKGKIVTPTPPDEPKVSDVLVDFSKPLLDVFRSEGRATRSDFEHVLQLTSLIWNAALLPHGDQIVRAMRQTFVLDGMPSELTDIIDDLILDRRTIYADDRRLVGDFEVQPGAPGEMRVSVAYAV